MAYTILPITISLLAAAAFTANSGGELAAPVRIQADGAHLDISKDTAYAGPLAIDHDGDGKQDLIVTSIRGSFRFFKNVGTNDTPEYTDRGRISVGGKELSLHNW